MAAVLSLAAAVGSGCSSEEDPSAACADIAIDPLKEVMIVEPSVIDDERSKNRSDGAWSFRHAVEQMALSEEVAPTLVYEWLDEWARTETFNNYPVNQEPRADGMQKVVVCPWLKRLPANGCDASCSSCTARTLDLGEAPFRLIGIVFRPDLARQPDVGHAGEGRFIFALTDGAADDPTSKPLPMTIIFEYHLPVSRPAKEWAEEWHHLGTHAAFDEAYKADLEQLTNKFTTRGAAPEKPNGSAINQVRTNESALNWIWQLREFTLTRGRLAMHSTRNTPGRTLNRSATLSKWVQEHEAEIMDDKYVMPDSLLGGSADQFVFQWEVSGVATSLERTFVAGTCNGCHSQINPAIDIAFHISPFQTGRGRLSKFMLAPGEPDDEARRRSKVMRAMLCDERVE